MMPVNFMEGNRIFDIHGNAYALFILDSTPYAFLPTHKKIAEIRQIESAILNHIGEYYVSLLSKQQSLRQVRQTMQDFSKIPEWNRQTDLTIRHLERRLPFNRTNFLVFPLKKRTYHYGEEEWTRIALEYFKNIWRGIKDVQKKFAPADHSILFDVLESSRQQSTELLKNLRLFRNIRPATIHETEWYLKKSYFRGLRDPELLIPSPFPTKIVTKSGQTAIRPIRNSVISLSDSLIKEHLHYLKIDHGDLGTSYQTFYTSLHVPNVISDRDPTGREWIYGVLEKLSFPVDVTFHIEMERHTDARDKVNRKNKIAKSQVKEWHNSAEDGDGYDFNQSSVPEELLDDIQAVDSLKRKFREKQQPLMYTTTIFAIGANSYDQLKERMTDFKEVAEGAEHILANSPADMKKMFQSFYPFGPSLPTNWQIPMDPGIFAAGVPFGVRMLGDPVGFNLGHLLTGRSVFMNPRRPIEELQRTGAILISGALGSGKTVLMKYIIFMMLQWNAYCFANDPKGDWAVFFEHPEIKKIGKMISFTPDSDTLFTPFRLAGTKTQCYEGASAMMELIFNPDNIETRNFVLSEALDRLYQTDQWDIFMFKDIIQDMSENHMDEDHRNHALSIYKRLLYLPNNSVTRMIHGRDTGKHLFEDKRFVCAITRGLSLPGKSKKMAEWSETERYSVAMLYAIVFLALRYLSNLPQHVLKGLAWEEFWVLTRFERGMQLYDESLRLSRSQKMIPIMASQNPTDVEAGEGEDDVTGLFGWKFMLRLDSKTQVEYALHQLMGMEDVDVDSWTDRFSDVYKDGLGLVRDPEGRVGEMQVEILDPDLMKYLVSTPPGEVI